MGYKKFIKNSEILLPVTFHQTKKEISLFFKLLLLFSQAQYLKPSYLFVFDFLAHAHFSLFFFIFA